MSQNLNQLFAEKNELVKKGAIVEATEKFFADNVTTVDFDGAPAIKSKAEELAKMTGFANAIATVNGITLHHAAVEGNVSFAEFTFDFIMKDNSKILWHEIIRSVWHDGKIIHEQYFKA